MSRLRAATRHRIQPPPPPPVGGTGTGTVPAVPGGAINVTSAPYSAIGNGTTDDGPAIRAAVTAAGVGGTVYFPAGTYRYVAAGTLQLNGTKMQGAGQTSSILLYESTAWSPVAFATGNDVAWKSMQIKRNSAVDIVMFPLQPYSGWTFDDVLFDGNRGIDTGATDVYGFQIGLGGGTLASTSFLNSTFKNFSQFPLFQASQDAGTTSGFTVRNCLFQNNYHTHLEFNAPSAVCTGLTVENSSFIGQYGPAAGGFGVGLANCKNSVVRYCYFEDGTQEAVHVEDRSDNITVEFNRIVQCGKLHFSQVQVVSGSTNVRVQHNVIDGTGSKDGQYIAAVAALRGGSPSYPATITIDDNTIDQGANLGVFYECDGVTVTNNRFPGATSLSDGGSIGTVTVFGNAVGTAWPAGFPGA